MSANAGIGPIEFDNINPIYSTQFTTFSAQRLFTAVGSNIVDVNFFVPGSNTAALTRGFGVVFTDVELANTTSLQFFDANNNALGTWFAGVGGNALLSFVGVDFLAPIVSRVRITSGNLALGAAAFDGANADIVAMDDFIYGEPLVASAVPEPSTVVLCGLGLAAIGLVSRRRRT